MSIPLRTACGLFLLPVYFAAAQTSSHSSNGSSSATTPSIQEIRNRMKEQGIRIPEMNQEQKAVESILSKKMSLSDTVIQVDSIKDKQARKEEKSIQDTSVYERIIRGELLNPDQILSGIDIFGYSVFRQARSPSLEPNNQVSVPADYLVAPGDEVVITSWGRINEEHRLMVNRDGNISIPRIGPVPVAGMPFKTMQKNLVDHLQSIEGVQGSVSMGTLRSMTIFVVGEVAVPGQYTLSALSNVTSALFAAGGVTKRASLRTIQLRRNGRLVADMDFYEFLLSGNNFGNVRLQSGDVLFVPVVKNMVAVAGSVRRSALYEFKGKTSLKDIIDLAGGFTPAAWINRIQIDRFIENKYQVVLDLKVSSSQQLPDFTIEDGDIIRIFQIVDRDKNAVYLSGNVKRPGKYEFKDGMRVRDVIKDHSDLLPETFFSYAVVHRFEPPQYTERIVSFSLEGALQDSGGDANLSLQPNDNIIVYHRDYFEPDRTVSIGGAVTSPGKYRLLDNMKIKDLILQAGGFTDAASVERGELYRRIYDKDNVSTEKTPFCVQCAVSEDPEHNLILQKLDHVYIRDKRGWEEVRKVALLGEVVFPGEYVLLPGEALGELIRRAGGFKDEAYLEAVIFTRVSIKDMERKRNEEYVQTLESNIARMTAELASKERFEEANYILQQQVNLLGRLREIKPVGRVVIDFTKSRNYENFTPENGDTLYAPKKMNTVSVMGEVFNPATFQHNLRKNTARHYIELSGGMKETADRRHTYIILANGSVVSGKRNSVKNYHMKPGDVVIVPQRLRYVSGYKVFMETIDAVYKVAMTAAVVITLIYR